MRLKSTIFATLVFLLLAAAAVSQVVRLPRVDGGGAVSVQTDIRAFGAIDGFGVGGASQSATVRLSTGYYPAQFAGPPQNAADPEWMRITN